MSREILFKAKVKDSIEWIKGGLIVVKNTERRFIFIVDIDSKTALRGFTTHCSDKFDWRSTEADPDTVCQFTGLKTVNNDKIWENDIIIVREEYRGLVKYDHGAFVVEWLNVSWLRTDLYYWANKPSFKIVGNAFDTPELLGTRQPRIVHLDL